MLDLGCGPGWETLQLRRPGLTQYGFNVSEGLLSIARKNNPDATFVQGDMRHLPFPDAMFDGVFAKASLLHLPNSEVPEVLKEIHRVLKPRGLFHLALKKRREGQPSGEVRTERDYGYDYARFFSYWTMPELMAILPENGFTVTDSTETPSASRGTIWLKLLARAS